jgi:hypothetical protein
VSTAIGTYGAHPSLDGVRASNGRNTLYIDVALGFSLVTFLLSLSL